MLQCNRKLCAKTIIKGSEAYPNIHGEVLFYNEKNDVLIHADICGLPQNDSGFYGFHIHEGTDCGSNFKNTGGHLNLEECPHPFHTGDLPPLLSCSGNAYMTVKTDRFKVKDIIGRTVIIHYGADDFRTQPSGDSGEKIACGIINAA